MTTSLLTCFTEWQSIVRMSRVSRIEKWWVDLAWYCKLGIVFGGMILGAAGMIIHMELTAPDELLRTRLPGTQNETQSWEFTIDEPGDDYVLMVCPDVTDGWGSPKVFVLVDLLGPDGTKLLDGAGKDGLGGTMRDINAPAGYRDLSYEGRFSFPATSAGKYTVCYTVLSEHIDDVRVSLGRKKQKAARE